MNKIVDHNFSISTDFKNSDVRLTAPLRKNHQLYPKLQFLYNYSESDHCLRFFFNYFLAKGDFNLVSAGRFTARLSLLDFGNKVFTGE